MHIIATDRDAGGYEAITVADTAIGFSGSKMVPGSGLYAGKMAKEVFCSLETASIRYTTDGTTPTTSVGHLVDAGQTITLKNPNIIKNFSAIRTGASSGSLKVTYMF